MYTFFFIIQKYTRPIKCNKSMPHLTNVNAHLQRVNILVRHIIDIVASNVKFKCITRAKMSMLKRVYLKCQSLVGHAANKKCWRCNAWMKIFHFIIWHVNIASWTLSVSLDLKSILVEKYWWRLFIKCSCSSQRQYNACILFLQWIFEVLFKEQFWSDFVEAVFILDIVIKVSKKIPKENPFILRVYLCTNKREQSPFWLITRYGTLNSCDGTVKSAKSR